MSLVKREMAAQGNGYSANGDPVPKNERLLLERGDSAQLSQRNGSHSNGDDLSRNYNAPPSSFSIPKQNGAIDKAVNPLADFFSTVSFASNTTMISNKFSVKEVFQIVLHNPTTAHRLLKFSQARMCGENMEFLEKVGQLSLQKTHSTNT